MDGWLCRKMNIFNFFFSSLFRFSVAVENKNSSTKVRVTKTSANLELPKTWNLEFETSIGNIWKVFILKVLSISGNQNATIGIEKRQQIRMEQNFEGISGFKPTYILCCLAWTIRTNKNSAVGWYCKKDNSRPYIQRREQRAAKRPGNRGCNHTFLILIKLFACAKKRTISNLPLFFLSFIIQRSKRTECTKYIP